MSVEQSQYAKFNEAMANFQKEYTAPKKDKKVDFKTKSGQHIKYDYSDLESLQSAIRETAGKHGLSWNIDFEYKETTVTNYGKDQKALMIITNVIINHSSGVEKHFKGIPLFATAFDPQGLGSVKTYSERYALSGAFGIASGEDDEQILSNQQNNQVNNSSQEPPRAELDNELEATIKEYQSFLLDRNLDLGAMNKYIINQEHVDTITQVPRVKVMGYLKSQVQKIKTQEAQKEAEQNKQQDNTEQQSLMNGNTTQAVNWGSAE